MKKNIICLCIVFLLVLAAGQIGKREFPLDLLGNAQTLKDIEDINFQFAYVDRKKNAEEYLEETDDYIESKKENDYIAVVTATENVKLRSMSVLQEVVIEKIIKGKGLKQGDKIGIYENSCFYGQNENKDVYLFDCGMNLMQEGNSYLVFFNEQEHENRKFYEACGGAFQYINLSNQDPMYLVKDPDAVYTYKDFTDYEYFSISKKALRARYELKHRFIDKWLNEDKENLKK